MKNNKIWSLETLKELQKFDVEKEMRKAFEEEMLKDPIFNNLKKISKLKGVLEDE